VRLVVERPGMFTTIQDGGRWGFARWGVPVSGPMDRWSARLANRLVGNPDASAVIEVTLVGPRLRLELECAVAITGAEFDVEVGTRAVRSPWSGGVPAGSTIAFGARHTGARAYVSIGGSFAVPRVLGSRSTEVRAPFAGLAGRALRTGDEIPLGEAPSMARVFDGDGFRVWWDAAARGAHRALRVIATEPATTAFETLCATPFVVSTRSDRMGCRLEGTASWGAIPGSLPSIPTTLGAVQLPPGGSPILLLADHPTTGGYAQIAVLCRADRQIAGQLAPGDRIQFVPISRDEARAAHLGRERALTGLAPEVLA
jgi:antagonist of KipI